MIAFPCMLVGAAERAGMKVPNDPNNFENEKEEYVHFYVFCIPQLCRRMGSPTEHWENAKLIASISEDKLKTMTLEDFIDQGLLYST